MENSSGYTASNFRDRICSPDILNIDLNEWQQWAVSYQDKIWKKYYDWCSTNGFVIANKCTPIQGQRRDRYVQYPKVHSKLVLNREDLKKLLHFLLRRNCIPMKISQNKISGILLDVTTLTVITLIDHKEFLKKIEN